MAEPVDHSDGTPGGDQTNDAAHPSLEGDTGQSEQVEDYMTRVVRPLLYLTFMLILQYLCMISCSVSTWGVKLESLSSSIVSSGLSLLCRYFTIIMRTLLLESGALRGGSDIALSSPGPVRAQRRSVIIEF